MGVRPTCTPFRSEFLPRNKKNYAAEHGQSALLVEQRRLHIYKFILYSSRTIANTQIQLQNDPNTQYSSRTIANTQIQLQNDPNTQYSSRTIANTQYSSRTIANTQYSSRTIANTQYSSKKIHNRKHTCPSYKIYSKLYMCQIQKHIYNPSKAPNSVGLLVPLGRLDLLGYPDLLVLATIIPKVIKHPNTTNIGICI